MIDPIHKTLSGSYIDLSRLLVIKESGFDNQIDMIFQLRENTVSDWIYIDGKTYQEATKMYVDDVILALRKFKGEI